jgi:hypothetical protein
MPKTVALELPSELGGLLRLHLTVASGPRQAPPQLITFAEAAALPITAPIAPGAPILTGTGRNRRKAGAAAVLVLDRKLHLLTCGHLFTGGSPDVFSAQSNSPIAHLGRSYLPTSDPLDAAVCPLTAEGVRLLKSSFGAATWFEGFHEPAVDDNTGTADFWPTNRAGAARLQVPISAFSATTTVLFSRGPFDGFIELGFGVIAGDSGSLLSIDDLYFGLCSGQVQRSWSYFTPIATVLERLSGDHQEVALWHPDAGIPT